MLIHYFEEAML